MTEPAAITGTPILILGSHRSGTSLVAGLLHAAGMAIGEPLDPGPDNPKGYFESRAVWAAHEHILASLDRDWTRPPARIDRDDVDTTELRRAVASVAATPGRRWGVKDPRAMFLLDLWAHLVPEMQLVGVVRNPNAAAASLVVRDRMSPDRAHAIADAHTQRLAELHRHLAFPLVEFTTDRMAVVGRVRQLAEALDLEWDGGAADRLYDQKLVHHGAHVPSNSPDYQYLVDHVFDPIEEVPVVARPLLVRALRSLGSSELERLDQMVAGSAPAPPPHLEELLDRIARLEADIEHRDNLIRDLREELAKATIRLEEETEAAVVQRRDLEAALAAAEARLETERERHRAAAEAFLADNAALRHWLLESRNTLAWREADLANEQRKVEMLTRFIPRRIAGPVWQRLKKRT